MNYPNPHKNYSSLFWVLVRRYGLTPEEAAKCMTDNMGSSRTMIKKGLL